MSSIYPSHMSNGIIANMRSQSNLLNKSINALSTGKKNPNPSDISRISNLNTRSRVSRVAQKNIQDGMSYLQTADDALSNIEQMGQRMNELSIAYANENGNKDVIKKEATALYKEIEFILENTTFEGKKIFNQGKNCVIQTGGEIQDKYIIAPLQINLGGLNFEGSQKTINTSNSIEPIKTVPKTEVNLYLRNRAIQSYSVQMESMTLSNKTMPSSITPLNNESSNNPLSTISGGTADVFLTKDTINAEWVKSKGWTFEGNKTADGVLDGYQQIWDQSGSLLFQGEVESGVFSGFQRVFNEGICVREGVVVNGEYEGWAKIQYEDGTNFMGYHANGIRNGWGVLLDSAGNVLTQGEWTDGRLGEYTQPGATNNGSNTTPPSPPIGEGEEQPPIEGSNPPGTETPSNGIDDGNIPAPGKGNNSNGNELPPNDDNNMNIENPINNDKTNEATGADFLLSGAFAKDLLSQVSNQRSSIAISEGILEKRFIMQENIDKNASEVLSRIQDTDVAFELLNSVKQELLLQTNSRLLNSVNEQITNHRSVILQLLS